MVSNNIEVLKAKTFPWKLHAMLELADRESFGEVVSWLPDGKSFKVYNPPAFVHEIMPNFFQQSKYKSFQRQLNLWGFERITIGPSKGGYYRSDFFCRKNPDEIRHIQRRKIKNPRLSKKKSIAPTKIIDVPISKVNSDQPIQSFSTGGTSIVSNNYSDVSSISSDSECEHGSSRAASMQEDLSPMPILEIIRNDDCPQTGDCFDFEGRSFFFVDEEEVKATTRKNVESKNVLVSPLRSEIVTPLSGSPVRQTPPEKITLCPSSMVGIALYREFFSKNTLAPRFGSLRA